jgi:hypothetical protein
VLTVIALSAGCWEEIHYTPPEQIAESTSEASAEPATTKVGATTAEPPATPSAAELPPMPEPAATPPPETPPAATPESESAAPPRASELQPPAASPEPFPAESSPSTDPFETEAFETPPAAPPSPVIPAVSTTPIDLPADAASVRTATPHELLLVWRVANKWSLAAAAYAKGLELSRYEPMQKEAAAAAAELGVELPALPTAEDGKLDVVVIESLRSGAGAHLATTVLERFGSQAGAEARLAIASHVLLLVYTPHDSAAASHAAPLRAAGEGSGLPAELWQPLVELVEKRAEFVPVRSAVFELDRRVEEHLGRL